MEQHDSLRARLLAQVEAGGKKRDNSIVKEVFNRHCNSVDSEGCPCISKVSIVPLREALRELGIAASDEEVFSLFDEFDTDDSNQLDENEFAALVSKPNHVVEWARELPLCNILADLLSCESSAHPLRTFSELSEDHLDIICECYISALKPILKSSQENLRNAFRASDSRGAEISDSKFSVATLSCGDVHDYHRGLQERIGKKVTSAGNLVRLHSLTVSHPCLTRHSKPEFRTWHRNRTLSQVRV